MFDDDFFLDDGELGDESQLSIVDEAKLKILETIESKIKEAKDNINFFERSEFQTNFSIISRYVGAIIDIERLEENDENLSDEEIIERIEEIELTAKELSFNDLKEYNNKDNKIEFDKNDDSDDELGF